jgi:hypothetical protein
MINDFGVLVLRAEHDDFGVRADLNGMSGRPVKQIPRVERWLRKFGQSDKWRPCFTVSVAGPNTGARA